MKNLLLTAAMSIVLFSCSKSVEKPAVSISHYANQVNNINEVVNKLMNETNIKLMHDMADGVEETRAIGCDQVHNECNAYYEFLNKVVNVTNDGELSAEDRATLEQYRSKLNTEIKASELQIQKQWKDYINADKRD